MFIIKLLNHYKKEHYPQLIVTKSIATTHNISSVYLVHSTYIIIFQYFIIIGTSTTLYKKKLNYYLESREPNYYKRWNRLL